MTAMLKRVVVGLVGALTEGHQLVERRCRTRAANDAEVLLHQLGREAVDAGRHRCVRGEHTAGANDLDRLGERQARLDQFADALERQEAGVTLVGVEHLRVQAERAQHPNATDAEDDLLAQAVLDVAAVQPVGDGRDLGAVAVDRGVEQVEVDPADVDLPHVEPGGVAGDVDARPAPRSASAPGRGIEAGEVAPPGSRRR